MAKTRDGCSNGLCSVSKNPAAVKATDFYVKPLTFVHRGHSALVTTKGTTMNKEGPHNQRQKQGQGDKGDQNTCAEQMGGRAGGRERWRAGPDMWLAWLGQRQEEHAGLCSCPCG